ncbi:unnamed protein product [Clavelina lepadiformis]|uniref:Uncharacterized protein n=1 Tax=Clavelina lepadiformis TaxID=159417 RepID=A0ABP0EYL7_CLALP
MQGLILPSQTLGSHESQCTPASSFQTGILLLHNKHLGESCRIMLSGTNPHSSGSKLFLVFHYKKICCFLNCLQQR